MSNPLKSPLVKSILLILAVIAVAKLVGPKLPLPPTVKNLLP